MKKLWAALVMGMVFLGASAADKLPKYDSPEWHALPGLEELKAIAEKGNDIAYSLLSEAIIECKLRDGLPIDTIDRYGKFREVNITAREHQEIVDSARALAQTGFYMAQRELADILRDSGSQECLEWYRKAAAQGDAFSQYNMALALILGKKDSNDLREAVKYLELAVAQGTSGALEHLGSLLLDGQIVQKDIPRGIDYLKRAADKGLTTAAFSLGEIYFTGEIVPADMKQAAVYFRRAAEQEKSIKEQMFRLAPPRIDAVMQLSEKFLDGDKKEQENAIREMTKLANGNNSSAQACLALLLNMSGRKEESKTWFCRSLGNGAIDAFTTNPAMLEDKFSPEQKKLLEGIFILADYADHSDAQYIASHPSFAKLFPEKDTEKYTEILLRKGYPKVIYTFLSSALRLDKNLTDQQKVSFALEIRKCEKVLRQMAADGDNDAVNILKYCSPDSPAK